MVHILQQPSGNRRYAHYNKDKKEKAERNYEMAGIWIEIQ